MFRLAADVQVYLHREAIDFRIGINGLAILVEQAMHLDPFGRAVFAFCNRRGDALSGKPLLGDPLDQTLGRDGQSGGVADGRQKALHVGR
jgi:hypothetical protein